MNCFWTSRSLAWVQLEWKFVLHFRGLHQVSKKLSQWDDNAKGAFGTVHALKEHKYDMHKRSKCEICGQSLCNTFWLKRHMSALHGIMPEGSIPCSHCPLFFSSKGAKDNHVKKQHADLFKVWTIGFKKRSKLKHELFLDKQVMGLSPAWVEVCFKFPRVTPIVKIIFPLRK